MIRDDLSEKIIHLTRGPTYDDAAEIFLAILAEKQLRGGTGLIKGGFSCVCFSEAPVAKLSQILANPMAHGIRYKPFGVMIDKRWLFEQGGRPVVYQPDYEFELLHDMHKFRHVRYEPKINIDYTWEREWRIQTDKLALDPEVATIIVPNHEWVRKISKRHEEMLQRRVGLGVRMPMSVIKFPWHFIALEDIGVSIPVE